MKKSKLLLSTLHHIGILAGNLLMVVMLKKNVYVTHQLYIMY